MWQLRLGNFVAASTHYSNSVCIPTRERGNEVIRLDCDREASHNLNRALDKPGSCCEFSYGNIFIELSGLWGTEIAN